MALNIQATLLEARPTLTAVISDQMVAAAEVSRHAGLCTHTRACVQVHVQEQRQWQQGVLAVRRPGKPIRQKHLMMHECRNAIRAVALFGAVRPVACRVGALLLGCLIMASIP